MIRVALIALIAYGAAWMITRLGYYGWVAFAAMTGSTITYNG